MGLGVPHFAARRFSACPATLQKIRHYTHQTLEQWGLASCAGDATAITNELVANALHHSLSSRPCRGFGWLGLMHAAGAVICVVKDPTVDAPVLLPTDHRSPAGRGLVIVASLSDSWGYSTHGATGKTVWARLLVSKQHSTPCINDFRRSQFTCSPKGPA
ncbi:ATP-binding protein [Streptomyces lydicus]|uniref:ATP-binding protein n=1 Tax=Streptomyces lydicus TaxID=47763 RepID=UPI0036958FF5